MSEHVGAGSNIGYEVSLRNTRILPTQLRGPFERGWTIFLDPAAQLRVTNSSLNKLVFQEFVGQTLTFEGLRLGVPVNFDFRDLHLASTTVTNQWGVFARDSNVTRRIPVRVRGARRRPLRGVTVRLRRGATMWRARTGSSGVAIFTLTFDEANLREPFSLSALGRTRGASFFSDTPIELKSSR